MAGRGGARYGAGRKGRKPKPTALKILAGNPGGRPLNENEPEPPVPSHVPKPPDHLDDIAKAEWERRAQMLLDTGLFTSADTSAFEAYCCAYSRFVTANKELKKGMIIKSPNDYPILNPYLSVLRGAVAEMGKFLVEFGMTPSSRSRIQVKRNKTPEPAAPAAIPMENLEDKYLN